VNQPRRLSERLRERARAIKNDVHALALAFVHPDTPWYARLYLGIIVAYVLSPIDLIPDFIPVVGYLDELVLVPLFLALALRIVPPAVLADCRARAADAGAERRLRRRGGLVVVMVWVAVLGLLAAVIGPRVAAAVQGPRL
jgi:uncharacterized membrane protein YkvA (DUF1232 family)